MRVLMITLLTLVLSLNLKSQPPVSWLRQYVSGNSPAFDFAYSMTLDGSNNIIVTGSSWGTNQLPDLVTIKYNGAGDTLWVRRWNGPGDNWDIARAITVDQSGNIFITGETYSTTNFFDFITIKYDAAGNKLWEAIYDGPLHSDDAGRDIAVDESGNVFVTGHTNADVQSRTDFATIKYNSEGQQQWIRTYNGPASQADFGIGIGVDKSGNIYVAGTDDDLSVNNFPAFAMVKYNTDGVQQWANRYRDLWTYAADMTVDELENSYVTGHSYSSQGGFYDYATVKYNAAGTQQWVRRFNGPGSSDDYGKAITVDHTGNVYVTGEAFFSSEYGTDYATIKYNSSGSQQWVAQYNGPGNALDVAHAISLDVSGNIYVTGDSRGANGDDDYGTVKYNPAGVQQWAARHTSVANEVYDLPAAIVVDLFNNVYVSGRSNQVGSSIITTVKYAQAVVVPINLLQFSAAYNYGRTLVNWQTSSELNTLRYEVERSVDGINFSGIGNVMAAGTINSARNYQFIDPSPGIGIVFYRLKIIYLNGNAEYSQVVKIKTNDALPSFSIYPNPVVDHVLILHLNNQPAGNYSINLFNAGGQRVYIQNMTYTGGNVTQTLNLPVQISKGVYHVLIHSVKTRLTEKIVVD